MLLLSKKSNCVHRNMVLIGDYYEHEDYKLHKDAVDRVYTEAETADLISQARAQNKKVTLPAKVAETLDQLYHVETSTIVYMYASGEDMTYPELVDFASSNFDVFLAALVHGYQKEQQNG